jgi:hypothetical protein
MKDAAEQLWKEAFSEAERQAYADKMMTTKNEEWERWVDEKRIDAIGQNGNDGLHYEANQIGFSDDGRCPSHYDNEIQPWDYMQATMTEEAFNGYLTGNIIKYVSRFEHKGGRDDLVKAQHYLDKLLSVY